MKVIDLKTWERKEYFDFFSTFDDPFHGLVSEIDCTNAFKKSKLENISFFSIYLHHAITAINKIDAFKYRIEKNKVVLFNTIHTAPTIGRIDGSFSFSFNPYNTDFNEFDLSLKKVIKQVQNTTGLGLSKNAYRPDVVHFSSIPWSNFTSITHARNFKINDSIPKITFGKIITRNKKMFLPIAINVHHGFADGRHISMFLDEFQNLMNG